nr:MAG TPA: hypothetical protein [Caudoviricetes sp.]
MEQIIKFENGSSITSIKEINDSVFDFNGMEKSASY